MLETGRQKVCYHIYNENLKQNTTEENNDCLCKAFKN